MQPLITVIVPVYKVEPYLTRCLDSLCRQSLKNIEILLIDDASPDRCGEICDAYTAKDTRFTVLHNEKNRGLSVARNIGIEHATADYLMFVDSDDWVHEDFCKAPYECAMKYNADLVLFRHQNITSPKHIEKNEAPANKSNRSLASSYKTKLEAIDLLHGFVGQTAWNKLYRKELFHNVSYPPGYLYEDVGTTYKTVLQAASIYFLDRILYYHRYRPGSITTLKIEKSLYDWIKLYMQQYYDLVAWGYPTEKLDALLKNKALSYCIKKKPDASDKHYLFCENVLLSSKSIPANYTRKQKVLFILFKYCRPLFELLCILYDKKIC